MGKYERDKGKRLEQRFRRWVEDLTGFEFKRTQHLGGKQKGYFGDVACVKGDWPFHVECRNREEDPKWTFHQVFKGGGPVEAWWRETTSKCDGLLPMLVFTRTRVPVYIMVDPAGWSWWCDQFDTPATYIHLSGGRRVFPVEDV